MQLHGWLTAAQSDIDNAHILLDESHLGYSMALCGACLDKVLKALWVCTNREHPPHHATLMHYAKELDLPMNERWLGLFATLGLFETNPEDIGRAKALRSRISKDFVKKQIKQTEDFLEWIKPMLKK